MQKRLISVGILKLVAFGLTFGAALILIMDLVPAKGQGQPPGNTYFHPPVVPRESGKELAMKIMAPFTFAGVGDMIDNHPVGDLAAPAFQSLVQVMRGADVTYANMEGTMVDYATFAGPIQGEVRPKALLGDLKAYGIRIMTTSNNHTFDAGPPAMLETLRLLDSEGIVHAGSGHNLQEARQAHFLKTSKGTIGVIGMYSIGPETPGAQQGAATYKQGTSSSGLPGLNPLHVRVANIVTAEQMQSLRKIRDTVYARRTEVPSPIDISAAELADQNSLVLFNATYKVGSAPGNLDYTMDPNDLKDILWSIRNGKEYSDFMVVAIHCHQNSYSFQAYSHDNDAPNFLIELAHKAIDNGADVFIAHGVHTLRPVEIYKGKPIFYGVSNFFNQLGQRPEPPTPAGDQTDAERAYEGITWATLDDNLEALLVTSHYELGKLTEVRIYPADLGQGKSRPMSEIGTPMTPSPENARKILEKVQRLSKPFGTTISIENNIGIIHVGAAPTQKSSADRGAGN